MARFEVRDAIVWSIPAAIACVAAVLAVRAFRGADGPPREPPQLRLIDPCSPGRYRCMTGTLQTTTGERVDGSATNCAWQRVTACAVKCASERVTIVVPDDRTAREQLCDPPKRPLALLSSIENLLAAPIADAGECEGDGYIRTHDGFVQCVRRSGLDPASTGVVIARATCRAGVVPDLDTTPRLIPREEAASVWCKRDPIADLADTPDAGALDGETGDAQ